MKYMEDVFHHEVLLNGKAFFYGIFDGHRGVEAAEFCKKNLAKMVAEEMIASGVITRCSALSGLMSWSHTQAVDQC